jgi:hypothetical protein
MIRNDFPHYWICSTCAAERGGRWPEGHVATCAEKTCKYCNGEKQGAEKYIAPYVDFDWPEMDTSAERD